MRCAGTPGPGNAEADPKRRECELPFGKGVETAFADGYPFLIATEVSSNLPEAMKFNKHKQKLSCGSA